MPNKNLHSLKYFIVVCSFILSTIKYLREWRFLFGIIPYYHDSILIENRENISGIKYYSFGFGSDGYHFSTRPTGKVLKSAIVDKENIDFTKDKFRANMEDYMKKNKIENTSVLKPYNFITNNCKDYADGLAKDIFPPKNETITNKK